MKLTLNFLKKIKKNNNTPWMHAHKDEYLAAKKEFEFLVQELIFRLKEWDWKLPDLEVKDCMFRFNRDTRFSDNKNPYKENFAAFFAYGGKKAGRPGYYFHVAPKEIFLAGGLWMPEPDKLTNIRRHILDHGDELKAILSDKKFKKVFAGLDADHVLKRPPKGFPTSHEHGDLLKFKSFTVSAGMNESDALKPGFGKAIDKQLQLIKPFNTFLDEALS
jgi:uncharacterized protein (TIGR02453 family)